MLRKLNLLSIVGMLVCFVAHALMSSFQLLGASADSLKTVGWVCIGMVSVHMLISAILTGQTLHALHRSGVSYWRGNELFWLRRVSGLAIVVPLILHLVIFNASNEGAYRLQVFTTGRMVSQILLLLAIALHVVINVKPYLLSFGMRAHRQVAVDILLVLSGLLVLFGAAFIVYYLRWMRF